MSILNARAGVRAAALVVFLASLLPGSAFGQGGGADPCVPYFAATPAGEGGDGHADHSGGGMPGATPESGPPDVDLAFIDLMSAHHEGAIAMGEIALVHAEHEEIAALGQEIIDTQRAEQAQLQTWRDTWFGDAPIYDDAALMAVFDQAMANLDLPADGGGLDHMDPDHDAAMLCTSSEPFDLAFIDQMISHHQLAIDMANVVLVAGTNDDLKAFARQVIETQSAEIARMEIWREQWFGATPVA